MACDSVHEFYYAAPPQTSRTNSSRAAARTRNVRRGIDFSDAHGLSLEDLEEHFSLVQSARISASEKLRAALASASPTLPSVADADKAQGRSMWTAHDAKYATSLSNASSSISLQSSLRSKSQRSPRLRSPGDTVVPVDDLISSTAIRDNTARANEWISETSPKVWLMDNEKEPWVQQKESERRRWRIRTKQYQKMRGRTMPFDDWLYDALMAERIADEEAALNEVVAAPTQETMAKETVHLMKEKAAGADRSAGARVQLNDLREFLEETKQDNPQWNQCFQKLADELAHGRCDLVWNSSEEIERIVHVAALHLETRDGQVLVQFGTWYQGRVCPTGVLPSTKQWRGETADESIQRMLKHELSVIGNHIRLGSSESHIHWRQSPTHGLRSKYIRTIVSARLEIAVESLHILKAAPKATNWHAAADTVQSSDTKRSRTSVIHGRSAQESLDWKLRSRAGSGHGCRALVPRCPAKQAPAPAMYMLWHGDEIELCGWLQNDAFERLRGMSGERQLRVWLNSVVVDPTLMPPKPIDRGE